jgi:hypothetical protein
VQLATAVDERSDAVRFVARTRDALCGDRLTHMGYLPAGDGSFATRWLPRSPELPRIYERFAASIERMVLQSARLVPVPWDDALLEFVRRVEGTPLRWWLYGSCALAVRGLDVEPGDVDLNVDDAEKTGRLLDDLLVSPVERFTGWVAGAGGRAFCHAIVEWLAEPRVELDDASAPYEQGPLVAGELEVIEWRGHAIRVPPLAAQLRVAEKRGLAERAALIRAALIG